MKLKAQRKICAQQGPTLDREKGRTFFAKLAAFSILLFAFSISVEAGTIGKPTNMLGMVGYWTFDGADMTPNVRDKSGSGNHGNISGQTSTTTSPGVIGQALKFDYTNDAVTLTQANGLPIYSHNTPYSMSFWIKTPFENPGTPYSEFSDNGQNSFVLNVTNASTVTKVQVFITTANTNDLNDSSVQSDLGNDQWHHIVWTDTSGSGKLYIDGVLDKSMTYTPEAVSQAMTRSQIGYQNASGGYGYFGGSIDEVRAFNRVLSAAEIKQLFRMGSSKFGATAVKTGGTLDNGLAGHWTFDGRDMSPNVRDISGSGYHGDLTGQASTTTLPGKLGQGLSFDGVDDWVSMGLVANGLPAVTATAWIKPLGLGEGNAGSIIAKRESADGWFLTMSTSNRLLFFVNYDGNNLLTTSAVDSISLGEWQHVAVAWDGTATAANVRFYVNGVLMSHFSDTDAAGNRLSDITRPLTIGNRSARDRTFNGMIDDARVYSRALSTSEIQQLYNMGGAQKIGATVSSTGGTLDAGLVAYWPFDGKFMTPNVRDVSGNGRHGNLQGQTSTSTAPGKIGQALSFDGVNDYAIFGDLADTDSQSKMTWSFWAKQGSHQGNACYMTKSDPNFLVQMSWMICNEDSSWTGTFDDLAVVISPTLTSGATGGMCVPQGADIPLNEWFNVTVVFDGTLTGNDNRLKIYLNGTQRTFVAGSDCSGTIPSSTTNSSEDVTIGTASDQTRAINAAMDDVRIYNRAFTPSEVVQLYNRGR